MGYILFGARRYKRKTRGACDVTAAKTVGSFFFLYKQPPAYRLLLLTFENRLNFLITAIGGRASGFSFYLLEDLYLRGRRKKKITQVATPHHYRKAGNRFLGFNSFFFLLLLSPIARAFFL